MTTLARPPLAAVVFDLDGTLLDTLRDIGETGNLVLEEFGHAAHPLEDYRRFVGDGVKTLMERIFPESARDPQTIASAVARFGEIYQDRWHATSQLYPGIRTLLSELTARNVPMTVLSNKPQAFTELCVQHFLAEWRFAIVYGMREGVPRKPDPTAALDQAARLQLAPAACAYVGDSSVDMQTATSAGMTAFGVAWGFRSITELRAHGAQAILHHPCDLLTYL